MKNDLPKTFTGWANLVTTGLLLGSLTAAIIGWACTLYIIYLNA